MRVANARCLCFWSAAPRSGLAYKHSIDVGAGVIGTGVLVGLMQQPVVNRYHVADADYRGNVGVILFNFSDKDFAGPRWRWLRVMLLWLLAQGNAKRGVCAVQRGDRIAQLILEKCATPPVMVVDDLSSTSRCVLQAHDCVPMY